MDNMYKIEQLTGNFKKIAFLIGNGPNIATRLFPSWNDLLKSLSDDHIVMNTLGLTNTEIFDLVELNTDPKQDLKKRVAEKLKLGKCNLNLHRKIMEYAIYRNAPVLTTNFDCAFENCVKTTKFHIESVKFTRFYPWKTYYGQKQLSDPTDGFGIWKVHGDVNYTDSIRLGLTDYMGSVERARKLIHNGDGRLFDGKRQENWQGYQTWLHIWFNLPIVIFGLELKVDEVFLRWLLIERKRYFNMIGKEHMDMFYLYKDDLQPNVANLLVNLGVQLIQLGDYCELYGDNYSEVDNFQKKTINH